MAPPPSQNSRQCRGAGASGLGEGRHGGIAQDFVEANHKTDLPRIGGGNQFVTVLLRPAEHCPGVPLHVDIVIRIVELPVEAGHMCPGRKLRKVPSGAVPIGGTAEFRVRRERKPQRDADRSVGHFFRLDPHGHGVLLRMPDSRYDHLPAVDAITARRRPRPTGRAAARIGSNPDPRPAEPSSFINTSPMRPRLIRCGLRTIQSRNAPCSGLGMS